MYNYQDSTNSVGAAFFFIFVVVFGSFIAMNLVLAHIMHSFIQEDDRQKKAEIELARKKKAYSALLADTKAKRSNSKTKNI